jgi:hypothetical protein
VCVSLLYRLSDIRPAYMPGKRISQVGETIIPQSTSSLFSQLILSN